jgi:hypothetical protein
MIRTTKLLNAVFLPPTVPNLNYQTTSFASKHQFHAVQVEGSGGKMWYFGHLFTENSEKRQLWIVFLPNKGSETDEYIFSGTLGTIFQLPNNNLRKQTSVSCVLDEKFGILGIYLRKKGGKSNYG